MATKRSTLGLWKYSAPAKQFDEPLWTQKDKMTPAKQWSCEEVSKWVTEIEGVPDNVCDIFLGCDVNAYLERFHTLVANYFPEDSKYFIL